MGVPLLGIIHDVSKFLPDEAIHYVKSSDNMSKEDFIRIQNKGFFHHQKRNKHHWHYWVFVSEIGFEILDMPDRYRREMLADFYAFEKKSGIDTKKMYLSRKEKMLLHSETREWLENQLSNKTS